MSRVVDLSGRRFGRLVVVALTPLRDKGRRAMWECNCDCGASLLVSGDRLRRANTRSCGCLHRDELAARASGPRQESVGYSGAHWRVRSIRGKASELSCVDCESPAQEWSYMGTDSAEILDSRGRPYSLDPWRYAPRCVPCHRTHDRGLRRSA